MMDVMEIADNSWVKINTVIDAIERSANAGLMGNRSAALADIKADVYLLRKTLNDVVTVGNGKEE